MVCGNFILPEPASYVIPFLWLDVFKNAEYQDSNFLIIHAVYSIAIVFILGTLLSILYNLTFDKLVDKLLDSAEMYFTGQQEQRTVAALKRLSKKIHKIAEDYCLIE